MKDDNLRGGNIFYIITAILIIAILTVIFTHKILKPIISSPAKTGLFYYIFST